VFLPQENEPGKDAAGIFAADKARIDWADGLVAIMDGPAPNSGTWVGAAQQRNESGCFRDLVTLMPWRSGATWARLLCTPHSATARRDRGHTESAFVEQKRLVDALG
jgi:hypothetical protein